MNDALEKRAQIQIHLNAVVKSLEEAQYSAKKEADERDELIQKLYAKIGELNISNDFLKKKLC